LVIDTSAILAVLFDESLQSWVIEKFEANRPHLRMSVVNYTEALILTSERFPDRVSMVERGLQASGIQLRPATARQAELAAAARLRYPLNLGDCFAYALAKDEDCPLLTLDRDFRRCDIEVVLPRAH
jgi:ribonuclease VapC